MALQSSREILEAYFENNKALGLVCSKYLVNIQSMRKSFEKVIILFFFPGKPKC